MGSTRGGVVTPTGHSYYAARARCNNPNHPDYRYYGGRGIRFRYVSYDAFVADLGEKPAGTSLDRIDTNTDYMPGNCRWATATQQSRNRRYVQLDERKVRQIRLLREMGYSQRHIGRMFGVDSARVSHIERGSIWKGA